MTRADADRARVRRLLSELGRHGHRGDRIYVSGGTSAIVVGWREFTQDVDVRIEAEDDETLLRAIATLKDRLDLNVELAGPLDFLPEPPGWRERSPYIDRFGNLDVFHTDFALQALAKLERGLQRDLDDVEAMLGRGLTSVEAINTTFAAIEPDLYRFPAVDAGGLREVVVDFARRHRTPGGS